MKKNRFAIATSIVLFYFIENCWYIIGLDNLFLLISTLTLFMRIIIKKRVEFEMKMFHLAACSLGWLMRSLRPQKCNLISSVNLDRKWPKQNWFSVLHISCVCHRLPAELVISEIITAENLSWLDIGDEKWKDDSSDFMFCSCEATVGMMTEGFSRPIRERFKSYPLELNFSQCGQSKWSLFPLIPKYSKGNIPQQRTNKYLRNILR